MSTSDEDQAQSQRERDERRARELWYFQGIIGTVIAQHPRLALSRTEAAEALGVSPEFFDRYVAPEIRCVRRGRRVMYSVAQLVGWLWWAADDVPQGGGMYEHFPRGNVEPG